MKRPPPKKNAECDHCLKIKPLLMPVSFIPGWPVVVWELLCLACRLNVRTSKHHDYYGEPGEVWKFSQSERMRHAYEEWLTVEP